VIRTETANLPAPISRHADVVMEWLREFGYTHCFFVAGGNIMHFLNGARTRFECIPFVHEVAAGIAVEYFNAVEGKGRAFALVTAGPGLTNIVTAVAGAFLESRELLVIGGQVKRSMACRSSNRFACTRSGSKNPSQRKPCSEPSNVGAPGAEVRYF
jgi:acetolactate synthase-1/2/3 large subunit